MQSKISLLMGASALLYLGPLLAGLSGMGWAAVPVFVALFALWLVVMRPAQWPRDISAWTRETVLAAAAQLAVNALIVIVLFGIGRGIGGVAGFLPQIPPFVPVALSFLAVPLSRMAVSASVTGKTEVAPAEAPLGQAADEMVTVLMSLPHDSDPMLTADAVDAAIKGPRANPRLAELATSLAASTDDHRALREAVILWATDPARHESEGLHHAQQMAFGVAGSDPVMLHLFAHRATGLLAQHPGLWPGFPTADQVGRAISEGQPENLQAGLTDLVRQIADASAPDQSAPTRSG